MDNLKYYIYRHIRLDKNEVFYIGVGTKRVDSKSFITEYKRAFAAKRRRSDIWHRIIQKTDYEVEIMMEFDNYDEALKKEIEFIAFYGRKNLGLGTLANLTDGGEGTVGKIVSKESIELTVAAHKIPIINKKSGEIYASIKEAAIANNMKYKILLEHLSKGLPSCPFKYLDNNLNKEYKNDVSHVIRNKETGEIFTSIRKAAKYENMGRETFRPRLNDPNFKYEKINKNGK